MKKQQVICDRCKRETSVGRRLIIVKDKNLPNKYYHYHENEFTSNEDLDLCARCFEDLYRFLEGRTLMDVGRDIFR